MNPTTRWTADQIRQKLKERKTCLVTFNGRTHRDLGMGYAAKMEGSYSVIEGKHETLILTHTQRKEPKEEGK